MSRMKTVGALIAASAAAACLVPAAAQAAGVPKDPILFVHGFTGNGSNWDRFKERLSDDGYDTSRTKAITFGLFDTNRSNAYRVRDAVNALRASTGARKVDIVSHSMGSVSSRYYLKFLNGTDKVDEWVSLAGPNHGLKGCHLLRIGPQPCAELVPSPWGRFMNKLNGYWLGSGSAQETPGPVRYLTVRSPGDFLLPGGASLRGATNVKTSGSPSHFELLTDREVYEIVTGFLDTASMTPLPSPPSPSTP